MDVCFAGNRVPVDKGKALSHFDFKYMRERMNHLRGKYGQGTHIAEEVARIYEAAKTAITAVEFVHNELPLNDLRVSISPETRQVQVTGYQEAKRYEIHIDYYDYSYAQNCSYGEKANPSPDMIGIFTVYRRVEGVDHLEQLASITVTEDDMLYYDMLFPAPTDFGYLCTN